MVGNTGTSLLRGDGQKVVFHSPATFFSGSGEIQMTGSLVGTSAQFTEYVGNILPATDNSSDLGSSSKRWANIHSADLHLSNENTNGNEIDGTTGNWTIQEGEDDLYLLNRKNGKKYKFKLEEVT